MRSRLSCEHSIWRPAAASGSSRRLAALFQACLFSLVAGAVEGAGTLFLDRCDPNCIYIGNPSNHSCTNRSTIVSGQRQVSAFDHSQEDWEDLVACVERVLAPYDVTVTTTEPECTAPYWEVAVAGTPEELGHPSNVAGVAPWNCGVIPNSPSFAFANSHTDMLELCYTVVHEFAHTLGADHALLVKDPMTYLDGCLPKRFSALSVSCGESVPRNCCEGFGAPTQSSDEILRTVLGQRPTGLLFPDSFEAWQVGGPETGSTCHWDAVQGEDLPPQPLAPTRAPGWCGTLVDSR